MAQPSALKYVALDSFVDSDCIPFSLGVHNATSHLSLNYTAWSIEAATSIGLSQISPMEFLDDLNSTIAEDPTNFRARSNYWLSQLSKTLLELATDAEIMSMVLDLCIISLQMVSRRPLQGNRSFFSLLFFYRRVRFFRGSRWNWRAHWRIDTMYS